MSFAVVIAGPTASGKTALSIEIAKKLNGEIVSADSMQIYRGMDIGTAKADAAEQAAVRHHMIDIVSPDEEYSVARYVREASACCDELISQGKVPVITGGTGLYIDSLLSGRDFGAQAENPDLRAELGRQYELEGGDAMLELLGSFDPRRAAVLHPSDKKRIIRAIEVYRLTGETISAHDERTRAVPPRYDAAFVITGYKDRQTLYSRIERRVDLMVENGLFNEVRSLLAGGISPACTAMQAIGYKETVMAINGEISAEEASDLIKLASRRYAKRQMTWFRRRENALRLYMDIEKDAVSSVMEYINNGYQ